MKKTVINIGKKLLPAHTSRRVWVKHFLLQTGLFNRLIEDIYQKWIKSVEPNSVGAAVKKGYRPLISILMPTYNTPDKYLKPLLESVKNQIYDNWQLCIADGSTQSSRCKAIKALAQSDPRISYKQLGKNLGIAGNTNAALKMARGEFVAFLDSDDLLAPFALNEVVAALHANPKIDLIYSDEDLCNDNGKRRFNPFFKPDWSPDLLWCLNYITHFVVARRSLVNEIGGLRPPYDGAQDYDFLLRITELTDRIYHVPKILYHWRMAKGSTATSIKNKFYALEAGRKALEDALARRKLSGNVEIDEDRPGNYKTRFTYQKLPTVALMVNPPYDGQKLGLYLSRLLELTDYSNLEIYLTQIPANLDPKWASKTRVLKPKGNTNSWQQLAQLKGIDVVLGIQAAIMPTNKEWLLNLIGPLQQPHVGAVSGLVVDARQNIFDFGYFKNGSTHYSLFKGIRYDRPTFNGYINWPRNFTCLSGKLFVIKHQNLKRYLTTHSVMNGRITPDFFYGLYERGLLNLGWSDVKLEQLNFNLNPHDAMFNPNLVNDKAEINLAQIKNG